MRRREAREAVRMARFLNLLHRLGSAELNQEEAAELLGVSARTFRRWTRRYEEEGEAGLLDRRLGKASGRRVPSDRAEEVERLYRERYQGFTVKHFHEHLMDLIVTMDDAMGAIYSAFLFEEEGTASTFRGLSEVFSQHGLPMSLYTDRGAHYFHTPKAGGEIDRSHPTQVGRALEQLGLRTLGPIRRRRAGDQSATRAFRGKRRVYGGSPGASGNFTLLTRNGTFLKSATCGATKTLT